MSDPSDILGTQIWLRHDDPTERVWNLFEMAADTGIGNVRVFLVWPWIEHRPDEWDFRVYDDAFKAASSNDICIKATLTANSGPWHIDTPSMLQSRTGFLTPDQRPKMRDFIHRCVERYCGHDALGQWVLWNEPNGRVGSAGGRSEESLVHWQCWLASEYDNIETLNRQWRTGFESFEEIPFPENIPHEAHGGSSWNSWQPWIADWHARADWLVEQLEWIKERVRDVDTETSVCVNPDEAIKNRARTGYDLNAMADLVDVFGATHHPPWHHDFVDRRDTVGLVAAGVRLQGSLPAADRVEVTEVQTGNTYTSGTVPSDVTPGEIARFHLAGLAAGAESITGWCFNVRSRGNEAGEWALLDDNDEHSRRSRALQRIHHRLDRTLSETGTWSAADPRAWVVSDATAQAQEWLVNSLGNGDEKPGRATEDSAHGALLLAIELMSKGIPTAVSRLPDVPTDPDPGDLVVASHQLAWEADTAEGLLGFADAGGTLLLDGTSGRFDPETELHRPWPGGIGDRIGLRGKELESADGGYETRLHGTPSGEFPLVRSRNKMTDEWKKWTTLRYTDRGPVVFERSYGDGRIVYARSPLAPAILHEDTVLGIRHILNRVAPDINGPRPVDNGRRSFSVPVDTEHGDLTVFLRTDITDSTSRMRINADTAAMYHDHWADVERTPGDGGELVFEAEDGVALLHRA